MSLPQDVLLEVDASLGQLSDEINALQCQINRLVKQATHSNLRIYKIEQWIRKHTQKDDQIESLGHD